MNDGKLTESERFNVALMQAAAHEVGHMMFAFSTGIQEAQIDFQALQNAEGTEIELRARTYRNGYNFASDAAGSGFAGSIAQVLVFNPACDLDQLYAFATDFSGISTTDRLSIEALSEGDRRLVFEKTLQLMQQLLPYIGEQTQQLLARVKDTFNEGGDSVGFLYTNPDPIPKRVAIRTSLF